MDHIQRAPSPPNDRVSHLYLHLMTRSYGPLLDLQDVLGRPPHTWNWVLWLWHCFGPRTLWRERELHIWMYTQVCSRCPTNIDAQTMTKTTIQIDASQALSFPFISSSFSADKSVWTTSHDRFPYRRGNGRRLRPYIFKMGNLWILKITFFSPLFS